MIGGEWNLNYRSPKAEGKVSKQLNELQPRAKSVDISSNSYTEMGSGKLYNVIFSGCSLTANVH
jgi:hypothetical protein